MQNGVVEDTVLVVLGHVDVHQLGILAEQRAGLGHVASFNGFDETAQGHAVEMRSQFGPALETIFPRDDELRVVKLKAVRGREFVRTMHPQPGQGLGLRLLEFVGQFLGLDLKLAQAGLRR